MTAKRQSNRQSDCIINFRAPREEKDSFLKACKESGRSQSEILRRAMAEYRPNKVEEVA